MMNPWPHLSVILDQKHRNRLRELMRRIETDPAHVLEIALDLLHVTMCHHDRQKAGLYARIAARQTGTHELKPIGDLINAHKLAHQVRAYQAKAANGPTTTKRD